MRSFTMSRKVRDSRRTRPGPRPRGRRRSGPSRLRLELLEDRTQPGETIGLGLSALPLGGLTGDAFDLPFGARADRSRLSPPAPVSLLDAPGAVAPARPPDQFVSWGTPPAPAGGSASAPWIAESAPRAGLGDDALAWHVAAHWPGLPAVPASAVPPGNVAGAASGIGAPSSLPGQ